MVAELMVAHAHPRVCVRVCAAAAKRTHLARPCTARGPQVGFLKVVVLPQLQSFCKVFTDCEPLYKSTHSNYEK